MFCDVCNIIVDAGKGSTITAKQFILLLEQGFGIDPENIKMLTESGLSKQQAINMLKQKYAESSSDWLLCPSCSKSASELLFSKPKVLANEDVIGTIQPNQQTDDARYKEIKQEIEKIVFTVIKKYGDKIGASDLIRYIREPLENKYPGITKREKHHIIRFLRQDYQDATASIKEKLFPNYEAIPKDTTVVARVNELHKSHIDIPSHLMQSKCGLRNGCDFDPNDYFKVLTHLSMKPGYMLDYFYNNMVDYAAYPCLFARQTGTQPPPVDLIVDEWKDKRSLMPYLLTDATPDGFFELGVFLHLAGLFYLWKHAGYDGVEIITSLEDTETIISTEYKCQFNVSQITAARSLETQPKIQMTYDHVDVTFCFFKDWGGFTRIRERFSRQAPHNLISSEVLETIKYDCGMRF